MSNTHFLVNLCLNFILNSFTNLSNESLKIYHIIITTYLIKYPIEYVFYLYYSSINYNEIAMF